MKLLLFDLSGTLVTSMRPPVLNGKNNFYRKLVQKGWTLGLYTGARKTEAINIIKKLKLYPSLFNKDLIFAKPEYTKEKNSCVFDVIKKKYNPLKIFYVGDTIKDYKIAKTNHVSFIYFNYNSKNR